MASSTGSKDGYYIRDINAEGHGPYTEKEFDAMRVAGEIDILKPKSAWRTAMGMAYRVNFKRRYNSIFSCAACGHAWELFIIFFTFVATVWAMTLVDFNDPKAGNAVYLIYILSAITFGMVIVTIRTVFKRWQKASSEVYTSEV